MTVHPAALLLAHLAAAKPTGPMPGYPVRQGLDQPTQWGGDQPPADPKPEPAKPPAGDKELTSALAAHLGHGLTLARDPQLKAHLASALAALHKHAAQLSKEHEQALAGKMSPRMMAGAR